MALDDVYETMNSARGMSDQALKEVTDGGDIKTAVQDVCHGIAWVTETFDKLIPEIQALHEVFASQVQQIVDLKQEIDGLKEKVAALS